MALCAPLGDSYLHNWINPLNLYHQTLMEIISKTVIYALKTFKTLCKLTVSNDVHKSMYVGSPSSSTSKNNVNKNHQ